ncbi:DUF1499 domain-containing protein [Pseudotabrizicola formosa]|uniref:DUF1499 domain-containing protein n=1 Tax=Pseudotabrizicola formosa TaxID=2030009 RepID=UPI000CD00017|nr:DUF1499 domain-containing protein [Pseudotabrizicola formosa]
MRAMGLIFAILIIAVLGLMAFVRLAPTDPARWHVAQEDAGWAAAPWDAVVPETGAARLRLSLGRGAPADLLARLDGVALATPRTRRLAGSVEEGRITYITRSALWGFPDFTTAEAREDGLYIHARLRFGREDMGVNARRLQGWQAAL